MSSLGIFTSNLTRCVGAIAGAALLVGAQPAAAQNAYEKLVAMSKAEVDKLGGTIKMALDWPDEDAKPVLAEFLKTYPFVKKIDFERETGIDPFGRLVAQVMTQPPYRDARRVFWIMDNGSSHRGEASVRRLTQAHPRIVPVHGPVHASWLNQIEIYFSIVQRKVLTPNDFPCLEAVAERLANFERYYESIAHPFEWKFTRADLNALIARMRSRYWQSQHLKLAA